MAIDENKHIKDIYDSMVYSNIEEIILYGTPINTKVKPNKPQGNYEFIEVNYKVEE